MAIIPLEIAPLKLPVGGRDERRGDGGEHRQVAPRRRVARDDRQRRVVAEGGHPHNRAHRPPANRKEIEKVIHDGGERRDRERRWTTAFTIAALTAVVDYLLDFLAIGWRPMRAIVWVSPFRYYPALSIVAGDAPAWRNLAVLSSVAAAFVAAAYWQFQRRDL